MAKSKIVGVIPSRFGAQRFPGKPLALIAGVPMIVRVIRQAQKAKRLTEVWVATDDKRIAEVVEQSGAVAVIHDAGEKNPIISAKAVPSWVRMILSAVEYLA